MWRANSLIYKNFFAGQANLYRFDVQQQRHKPSPKTPVITSYRANLLISNGFYENPTSWHALCVDGDIFTVYV